MEERLVVLVALLLMFVALFLSILLFLACFRRRWRLSLLPIRSSAAAAAAAALGSAPSSSSSSRVHASKVDDLETPLFSEDLEHSLGQSSNIAKSFISEESSFHCRSSSSPRRHGLVSKQILVSTDLPAHKDDSVVLDVVPDVFEGLQVGQTLKRSGLTIRPVDDIKHARRDAVDYDLEKPADNGNYQVFKDNAHKRSCLNLEVISGPSSGLHYSCGPSHNSPLQVTLGRVPPSELLLKDSEVSGKHALISWNPNKFKWELVDMGSLNGTLLNSRAVRHPDSTSRRWSDPVELANGDMITLGTSSKVLVRITPVTEHPVPFGVGIASDPMAMRRGGKKLPMEDISYCEWPLPGVEQFGLFGIFDGHGGAGAAKAASKMLPMIVRNILSNPGSRERVLSRCDASEVLRDAFSQTEAALDCQYEGCTATVLLVWVDYDNQFCAQCANLGDSACIMNLSGSLIYMTEDHRVTSASEQNRLREAGWPLKDGESRLCGLNLARMLGDKFLKEQDPRFSSQPFISKVVNINRSSMAFAVMASDGLWDVISAKKAIQLVLKMKERYIAQGNSADLIANFVLNEARTLRTKDNTTVLILDFDANSTESFSTGS